MDVNRRSLLAGFLAMPAVVAISSLMPLRGAKRNPIVRIQSWPFDTDPVGEWWSHEGPLSFLPNVEHAMQEAMGQSYWRIADLPIAREMPGNSMPTSQIVGDTFNIGDVMHTTLNASRMGGFGATKEEKEQFCHLARSGWRHRAQSQVFNDWDQYEKNTQELISIQHKRLEACGWA